MQEEKFYKHKCFHAVCLSQAVYSHLLIRFAYIKCKISFLRHFLVALAVLFLYEKKNTQTKTLEIPRLTVLLWMGESAARTMVE